MKQITSVVVYHLPNRSERTLSVAVCHFFLIVVIPIVGTNVGFALAIDPP